MPITGNLLSDGKDRKTSHPADPTHYMPVLKKINISAHATGPGTATPQSSGYTCLVFGVPSDWFTGFLQRKIRKLTPCLDDRRKFYN